MTATTTGPAKLSLLERLGAEAVVMDGLDALSVDSTMLILAAHDAPTAQRR